MRENNCFVAEELRNGKPMIQLEAHRAFEGHDPIYYPPSAEIYIAKPSVLFTLLMPCHAIHMLSIAVIILRGHRQFT
jgi:hypothetical protein